MTIYSPYNPPGTTRTSKKGISRHAPLLPDHFNHRWFDAYIEDFLDKNVLENNGVVSGCVISQHLGDDSIDVTGGEVYINDAKIPVAAPSTYVCATDGWYVVYVNDSGTIIYGAIDNTNCQGANTPDDAVILGYAIRGGGAFYIVSFFNEISDFVDAIDKIKHVQPVITVGPSLTDSRATNIESDFVAALTEGDRLLFMAGVTLTANRVLTTQVDLWMDGPDVALDLDTFDLTLVEASGYISLTTDTGELILNGRTHGLTIIGAVTVQEGGSFSGSYILNGIAHSTSPFLTSPFLTTPQINDASEDHQYVVTTEELTSDRNINLPLLSSDDEFIFRDHPATLFDKSITNHIWGTSAQATSGDATFYTDASGNPLDKDAIAVTIEEDDKILIAHNVTATANMALICGGVNVTIEMSKGVNWDLSTYDLSLGGAGDSFAGHIALTGTGTATIIGSRLLKITHVGMTISSLSHALVNNFLPINWSYAQQVGSDLNITAVTYPAITSLNGTDIAFIDATNRALRTYRFNGSTWSQVGSDLNITAVTYPSITSLNGTDIAFIDATNEDLRTYRFNGSTWSQVGSELNIASVGPPAITSLNGTDIAFIDGVNDDLRTYRFNGSTWSQVGSELNIASVTWPSITSLNGTDIAFTDVTHHDLRTYRFNGSTWSQVGSDLNITAVTYPVITSLNGTDIAFIDDTNDVLRIYRFNGSTWSVVANLNIAGIGPPAITSLNGTDIAFIDATNDDLRTYRFSFSIAEPYKPWN